MGMMTRWLYVDNDCPNDVHMWWLVHNEQRGKEEHIWPMGNVEFQQ